MEEVTMDFSDSRHKYVAWEPSRTFYTVSAPTEDFTRTY